MDPLKIPALVIALMGASPLFIALSMHVWESVKPLLVPQAEIDRLAEDCLLNFGTRAMDEIDTLAQRALLRGETSEHGLLLRIGRTIRKMEAFADPN